MARVLLLALIPLASAASWPSWKWQWHTHPPNALPFREIVVFGDSLSDNGNLYNLSNRTWPAHPGYYFGRFSDGPTWIEEAATELDIPLRNYAYGGATSDNDLVQGRSGLNLSITVPAMVDQVLDYIDNEHHANTMHYSLFVLCIGSNDIFFNRRVQASQIIDKLELSITRLRDNGAWAFLLVASPDLSRAPYFPIAKEDVKPVSDFSRLLRLRLRTLRIRLQSQLFKLRVGFLDLHSQFDLLLAHPARYGFDSDRSVSSSSCLKGIYTAVPLSECTDPNKLVYYDEFHPSAAAHKVLGRDAALIIRRRFS